jgi:hypothetical protein
MGSMGREGSLTPHEDFTFTLGDPSCGCGFIWASSERNTMIRKIALGAATTLLVVGLPVAALGFSQSLDSDYTPTVAAEPVQTSEQMELEAQEQLGTLPVDAVQAETQTQDQARAQEMIHAETGISDGHLPKSCQACPAARTLGRALVSA